MNNFWFYKGYLVRSREHLYFSLTALDLLLVCFHFHNESTDLIYWYTCLFSPLFTLRHMLCLTTVYKDISQNMHFDVVLSVFIHPCSKMRRAQFSIRAELTRLSVRVRFRCVGGKHFTQHATFSNNPERLIWSPRALGQSLYRVLTREIERECTCWW